MKHWQNRLNGIAAGLAVLVLAACNEETPIPGPQNVTKNSVAEFCGMTLQEHPGPKAQVFVQGRDAPYWFASVRDMFAYNFLSMSSFPVRAIYVNDMSRVKNWQHPEPGTWMKARDAFYVIGSDRRSGMNDSETIPFGTKAAADRFASEHGGQVVRFDAVPEGYILPGYGPSNSQPRSGSND
ncbi:MAG: nitrous oxide reductase accessory protein NosL [Hyphomicrobiaceae bacterium]